MHIAAPVAAGFVAGAAFIAVFVIWANEPPIYRVPSWSGQLVAIPEGASSLGGSFEPENVAIGRGDFVEWANNEAVPVSVIVEPACEPFRGNGATVTQAGTEKLLLPGEWFACLFKEAGEYRIHTEPWPWMQGTVKVSP